MDRCLFKIVYEKETENRRTNPRYMEECKNCCGDNTGCRNYRIISKYELAKR